MRFSSCLLAVAVVLGACHHGRKTLVSDADVPKNGDSTARSRYLEARATFKNDGKSVGEFKQIIEDYPQDPILPWVELDAGIAAIKVRAFGDADKHLGAVIDADKTPGLTKRAQLFLGIAKNYEGDVAAALPLLVKGESAIENDDERTEWLAAAAYATAASDRALASLKFFDELWGRANATERAMILGRIEEVVGAAEPGALGRAYDELANRKGPSIAIAGTRLAAVKDASGDAAGAAKLREDVAPVRAAVGLPRTASAITAAPVAGGTGDPGLVGAVLPLGSQTADNLAQRAVEGLGLASGAPGGTGVAAIEIRVAAEPAAAGEMVDQLAHQNVIAIVGPIGEKAVDVAAVRAEALGVPLLTLTPRAEGRAGGRFVFHLRHSPESRARLLARRAVAKGVKTFAVFAAESDYGRATTKAFVDEVKKAGGKVVETVTYPDKTKSFNTFAAKLSTSWDAVFAPTDADSLGLIAPALAAAGHIAKPVGTKKAGGGRPVLLLSTAEDLKVQFVDGGVGRHSDGALLAPGYYPDDADPANKAFIERFTAAYGKPPGVSAAYAYDAAQLAAAAGANGRAGLAATLATGQLAGLTGTIRFDQNHLRADDSVVYTVAQETGGLWAIRAIP